MRPVCVACSTFMVPAKNGVLVEECMDDGAPYKLWRADLYECRTCGHEIITGWGARPIAEHYQDTYASWKQGEAVYRAQRS